MHQVHYGLFFDNHTQADFPEMGRKFDPEFFTDELLRCKVDYLGFHARCNMGLAYYDTKIGIRHPSLDYDLFGRLAECCKRKGIALVAYFNGGISTMEMLQHREWQRVRFPSLPPPKQDSPYWLTTCVNSGYRDHLIAMVREVAANYPVSGFFIDCLDGAPCVCPICVAEMTKQRIDYRDLEAVRKFFRASVLRLCADISVAVREYIHDPMLYFNGVSYTSARELDTFFDSECLPTSLWGYECLPPRAHFMRSIEPAHQILNMTGRFYDWGDFGGLRTAESLKFDLAYGLAHGMRPNVGGHFHPRGDQEQPVFDRIAEVYHDLQRCDEYYENAVNPADTAIVLSEGGDFFTHQPVLRTASRMLDELKMQYDIVAADFSASWEKYRLLILPEGLPISPRLVERVREHLARGRAFFACGASAAAAFGEELGIAAPEDSGLNPVYFRMGGEFDRDVPDMDLSLYAPASRVEVHGARRAAELVRPYYNIGFNGIYPTCYTPPQGPAGSPFLTVNGRAVWCAGDLFGGYRKRGAIHLRDILRNVIAELLPEPLLADVKLSACARVVLTEQPGRMILHLLAYAPETRGEAAVVEEGFPVVDGSCRVKTGGRRIARAFLAPTGTPVEFAADGKYTTLRLPIFTGTALAVLEFEA